MISVILGSHHIDIWLWLTAEINSQLVKSVYWWDLGTMAPLPDKMSVQLSITVSLKHFFIK